MEAELIKFGSESDYVHAAISYSPKLVMICSAFTALSAICAPIIFLALAYPKPPN